MAQIKLLKIDTDGIPVEMDSASDDITLNSFTVQGGGPVLDTNGLDMNTSSIVDVGNLEFADPTTGYINATAANLIIDDIMAKDRENAMGAAGAISFPTVTDVAGEVDAFRLPALAGVPTATPTSGGEGHVIWDSSNNKMYIWDGSAWVDQSTIAYAPNVQNSYVAGENLAARDMVYISSADNVSKAQGDTAVKAQAIGFAVATATATNPVQVQEDGVLPGFTGLTAGARYYLSAATAGAITATIPTGTGQTIVQAGYAKSATALAIQIQQLGRRA